MVVRTCMSVGEALIVTSRHDRGHGDREVTEVDKPRTYVHTCIAWERPCYKQT